MKRLNVLSASSLWFFCFQCLHLLTCLEVALSSPSTINRMFFLQRHQSYPTNFNVSNTSSNSSSSSIRNPTKRFINNSLSKIHQLSHSGSEGILVNEEYNGENSVQQAPPNPHHILNHIHSLVIPLLKNCIDILCKRPPSVASIGFGLSCGLGYYLWKVPLSHASVEVLVRDDDDDDDDDGNSKIPIYLVARRVVTFWKQVAPIIVHYKFATFWMNRIKSYDRNTRDEIYETLHQRYAIQAKNVAYELKGLFIKICQVISSRGDFVPSIYIEHFSELQDNVPTHPVHEIKAAISKSLLRHHGLHFEDVFENFVDEPLGSASIGSVHAATLTDEFLKLNHPEFTSGKEVAVKVMHLDAKDRFRNDFKILRWLCRVALPGWSPILPELERQFMTEFDYRNEASNLHDVRKNMMTSPYRNKVRVPEPLIKFSTRNVLIMEKLEGDKLVSVAENSLTKALNGDVNLAKRLIEERRSAVMKGDLNTRTSKDDFQLVKECISDQPILARISILWQLASLMYIQRKNVDLLLDVHGYQIFNNGRFNGDPHPGNILILRNGQLGLIDYGQCYKLKGQDQIALSSIIQELGAHEVDESNVSSAMLNLGFKFKYENDNIVTEMAKLLFDSDTARIKLGFPSPQELMNHLNSQNPMMVVPDCAVFVCRTSFLFRGMGYMVGMDIKTASRWRDHAINALEKCMIV